VLAVEGLLVRAEAGGGVDGQVADGARLGHGQDAHVEAHVAPVVLGNVPVVQVGQQQVQLVAGRRRAPLAPADRQAPCLLVLVHKVLHLTGPTGRLFGRRLWAARTVQSCAACGGECGGRREGTQLDVVDQRHAVQVDGDAQAAVVVQQVQVVLVEAHGRAAAVSVEVEDVVALEGGQELVLVRRRRPADRDAARQLAQHLRLVAPHQLHHVTGALVARLLRVRAEDHLP